MFPVHLIIELPLSLIYARETFASPHERDNGNQMKFWYTKSSSERWWFWISSLVEMLVGENIRETFSQRSLYESCAKLTREWKKLLRTWETRENLLTFTVEGEKLKLFTSNCKSHAVLSLAHNKSNLKFMSCNIEKEQ
mgnify:CR=1 FL=1